MIDFFTILSLLDIELVVVLLNLIITDDEGLIQEITYHPELGLGDHVCISFVVSCFTNSVSVGNSSISPESFWITLNIGSNRQFKIMALCSFC